MAVGGKMRDNLSKTPSICSQKFFQPKFCYVCIFVNVYLCVLHVADPS